MKTNKYGPFHLNDHKGEYCIDNYKSVFDPKKGYVIAEPYPTQLELEEYYEGSYFEEGDLVKHDYLKEEKIYRVTYLKYIDSIFGFLDPLQKINALDYGCGVGSFVRSLIESNHAAQINSIEGYDLSNTAVLLAKENTSSNLVNYHTLDKLNNEKKYNLISMLEVVEHIPDVQITIKELTAKLEDNGFIFITTPNYNSFEQRFYKNKWRLFCPPEHINFFTKHSLIKLLEDHGYEVIKIDDEFVFSFSFGFRKLISNKCPLFLIKIISNLKQFLVYKILNILLRLLGFEGGKVTVIAQKKGKL